MQGEVIQTVYSLDRRAVSGAVAIAATWTLCYSALAAAGLPWKFLALTSTLTYSFVHWIFLHHGRASLRGRTAVNKAFGPIASGGLLLYMALAAYMAVITIKSRMPFAAGCALFGVVIVSAWCLSLALAPLTTGDVPTSINNLGTPASLGCYAAASFAFCLVAVSYGVGGNLHLAAISATLTLLPSFLMAKGAGKGDSRLGEDERQRRTYRRD